MPRLWCKVEPLDWQGYRGMTAQEDNMTALMKAGLYNHQAKQALITRDKWIIRSRSQGFSLRHIADRVGMSPTGVAKILKKAA